MYPITIETKEQFDIFAELVAQKVVTQMSRGKATLSKRETMKELDITFYRLNTLIQNQELKVDSTNQIYVTSIARYKKGGIAS